MYLQTINGAIELLQTIEPVAICDQFSFILMFYIICHIAIFIFEITNCDLKRVVTYYCMQR